MAHATVARPQVGRRRAAAAPVDAGDLAPVPDAQLADGTPTFDARPLTPARSEHPAVAPELLRIIARRRAHHRALVVATGAAAALALGAVAVDVWLWNAPYSDGVSAEDVSQALADAAAVQEAFHDLHGHYAADQGQLVQTGWVPAAGVDVSLVSAGHDAFCLAAGPAGGAPVAWITQDWTALSEPCD